jgi:hypothetical protein
LSISSRRATPGVHITHAATLGGPVPALRACGAVSRCSTSPRPPRSPRAGPPRRS